MDEQPCGVSIGGKCDSHPSPFEAANDFLPVAPATFHRTAMDSHHGFFSSRRSARHQAARLTVERRGKCHAQNFPFSCSLPGGLTMIFNALFQRMDS